MSKGGRATRPADMVMRSMFLFGRNNLALPSGPIYAYARSAY